MIVFDGLKLIGLAIMLGSFVICCIILVIDNIVYTVKRYILERTSKQRED